jgi:mRNA interferase RelE/StbE
MTEVRVSDEAQQQFLELPRAIKLRVMDVIDRLKKWPEVSGAKPLRGNLAGHYRIRTGDYRVQFRVNKDGKAYIVLVERIGHRDGFYEERGKAC